MEATQYSPTALTFDAALTFDEWAQIGATLSTIEHGVNWWIGDWINYGERHYGEKYTQAIQETGRRRQTLMNLAWVAATFDPARRHESLSWSHHEAVASLPVDEQDRLLDLAETNGLSRKELRESRQKEVTIAHDPPNHQTSRRREIVPLGDAVDEESSEDSPDELLMEFERTVEENVRLEERVRELEAGGGDLVAHLQKKLDDEKAKYVALEGRLHAEIERANTEARKAKYHADLLTRLRKLLKVDSNGEIEGAIYDLTR